MVPWHHGERRVRVSDYGYCWHPAEVAEDWRPYTDGYWAYTDAGWTWVSYEDWGGITVSLRALDAGGRLRLGLGAGLPLGAGMGFLAQGDDYIGWAPLPPECRYHPGVTIGVTVDAAYGIGPGWYNFCAIHDFGSPALAPVILERGRNAGILHGTVNITHITEQNGLVRNGGPSFQFVSARTARPIQRLALVRRPSPAGLNGGFQSVKAGRLQLVAPAISPGAAVRPPSVARVFSKPAIDHGWTGARGTALAKPVATSATFQKSASTKGLLEPFHGAGGQASGKPDSAKKFDAGKNPDVRKSGEVSRSFSAPKTVAMKTVYPQTVHEPTPRNMSKSEAVEPTLKLRAPPSPPRVSTAGGGSKESGGEKKDKKKDVEGN